jgi:hypothetical protein
MAKFISMINKARIRSVLVGFLVIGVLLSSPKILELVLDLLLKPTSPEIERLADAATMTPLARRLFYHQKPRIQDKLSSVSSARIADHDKQTIALGYYTHTQGEFLGQITIQSVTDPQLQGTMELTAAHEMLHAAYDRLSQLERDRLTPLLETAMRSVKDKRLRNMLIDYQIEGRGLRADGTLGDVPKVILPGQDRKIYHYLSELHSHLGTELADLGDPTLEQHYQQYFTDRAKLVALAAKSHAPLEDLNRKAEALKPEIDELEVSLNAQKSQLAATESKLQHDYDDISALESQLEQAESRTPAATEAEQNDRGLTPLAQRKTAFKRQVASYNEEVRNQKKRVAQLNQAIEVYQEKVNHYNELAKAQRKLFNGLQDSAIPSGNLKQLPE